MKNKLKQYREEAKLSQEELAKISGISRNTISALESKNNSNATYYTMSKIAKTLKKEIKEIFFEE